MFRIRCTRFITNLLKLILIFELCSINIQAATYNTTTGELFLPSLIDSSKNMVDVIIKLNPDGTYNIQDNTEVVLPFRCPGEFSTTTFDLIKNASSPDEINSILGCQWQSLFISKSPSLSSNSYTWIDSKCSTLKSSFQSQKLNEKSSSLTKTNVHCNLAIQNSMYDLQANLFHIGNVIVDKNSIASQVVIKFHKNNQYEIIGFAQTPRANPPLICELFTEEKFNKLSVTMTHEEISKELGCQWVTETFLEDNSLIAHGWSDNECRRITKFKDSLTFLNHKSGFCGNFIAH